MSAVVDDALNLVYQFVGPLCSEHNRSSIEHCLLSIAGMNDFNFAQPPMVFGSYADVQSMLARINENESVRKRKGVYYTPTDVVRFIVTNSIKASFGSLSAENIQSFEIPLGLVEDCCLQKTLFEPTCGAGEFLLEALNLKFILWDRARPSPDQSTVERMVGTIYGNDINNDSVIISKLRLFLCVANKYGVEFCVGLPPILNRNFTTNDYVVSPPNDGEYDIIVGNPPYVEDNKCGLELSERYGNIYANVLLNAAAHLNPGGSMGFIIPISYSSTPRMKKLRNALMKVVQEQYILCYADRPDCLFNSVHQKLCILICRNSGKDINIYTGNYQYWYQEERDSLFSNTQVVLNCWERDDCIPKLGTSLDLSIFQKVMNPRYPTVFSTSRVGMHSVYVNRREAFWIKAFRREIIHPEFKVFSYASPAEADYCYCLLNSSLFWWYWISVSDCWHVSRDLNGFRAPVISDVSAFTALAEALDAKLEATKEYVGTKQTEYEYKHRACLEEIHAIDDVINAIFGLTKEESEYIKSFALRYRVSGGAVSDERD